MHKYHLPDRTIDVLRAIDYTAGQGARFAMPTFEVYLALYFRSATEVTVGIVEKFLFWPTEGSSEHLPTSPNQTVKLDLTQVPEALAAVHREVISMIWHSVSRAEIRAKEANFTIHVARAIVAPFWDSDVANMPRAFKDYSMFLLMPVNEAARFKELEAIFKENHTPPIILELVAPTGNQINCYVELLAARLLATHENNPLVRVLLPRSDNPTSWLVDPDYIRKSTLPTHQGPGMVYELGQQKKQ